MKQALYELFHYAIAPAPHRALQKGRLTTLQHALCACLAGAALSASPAASALEFQCKVPNDTRYLRVEIPGQEYLCEVSVSYLESGERKVLWYARNDTLFCSARAYELRDKYEELWNYTCTTWPDRDGIDQLSASQRSILDQRLKALREQGSQSTPASTITAIKAVASTPLNNDAGKVAFQFFTEDSDFTEIIDDQTDSWAIVTSIENMASQVVSEEPVSSAIIHSITADGTLEVHTRLAESQESECFGTQDLTPVGGDGEVIARTPHRFVCNTSETSIQTLNKAAPIDNETLTR